MSPAATAQEDSRRVNASMMSEATAAVVRLCSSHYVSQCIYTFSKIGAPDAMAGDELSPPEIAARLKQPVRVDFLAGVLRFLACEGVVSERSRQEGSQTTAVYSLTDVGKLMQDDVQGQLSMKHAVESHLKPSAWAAWGLLHDAMVSPSSEGERSAVPFEMANGKTYFESLRDDPEVQKTFQKSMAVDTELEMPCVLAYDWSILEGKTLVDLGSCQGEVMEAVASKHPEIGRIINVDLPHVVEDAPKSTNPKVEFVAGDFFDPKSLPKCDAIFMKHILHDWNDDSCRKILRSCHEALSDGGRLIIVETVMSEPGDKSPGSVPVKIFDLTMMVLLGSCERSREQWKTLVSADGLFEMVDITPSDTAVSIVECIKL